MLFRSGVLDQNAEFQKIGSNLNELESDSISGRFETRICQVFGVPPILVGAYVGLLHVNQRASVREAQQDFWLNKMSPLFKSLRQFLTWNLLPEFEDIERIKRGEIRVNWDMAQVLALQEDLNERHDRARKNFLAGGLKLNEFRAEIGKNADDEADYYLRPGSAQLQTAEAAAQIAEITGASNGDGKTENQPKALTNQLRLELKAAATHEFSSTQLDLSSDEKKKLIDFGQEFIDDADLVEDGREDNPHITVKYGLHADNADDLKELLADVKPFEVVLGKTSIFPGKGEIDYDVVKIDVESPELRAVNKLIADNLENSDTHPKYMPHLTIAYVAKGKGKKYIENNSFDGQKIYFDKITFSDKNRKKTVIKLADSKKQKKTFDLDGVILSRPPNENEKSLDFKTLVATFESGKKKIAQILTQMRLDLLNQAYKQIENTDAGNIHEIILTPNAKDVKNIRKNLKLAFADGRRQIAKELANQKNTADFEIKDLSDDGDGIDNLSDLTISRFINEIQSRFSAELAKYLVLGFSGKDLLDKLKDAFKEFSSKFLDSIASRAVNKAINDGRGTEIETRKDEWEFLQYSAILDLNTCKYCEEADGETSEIQVDLTSVPNPDCEGGDQCRCFHIAVTV